MTLGEKLLELIETLPAAVSHVFGVMPEDILLAVAELRQRANIPSTFNQSIVYVWVNEEGEAWPSREKYANSLGVSPDDADGEYIKS
jgi:hypothetical protein